MIETYSYFFTETNTKTPKSSQSSLLFPSTSLAVTTSLINTSSTMVKPHTLGKSFLKIYAQVTILLVSFYFSS